MNGLKRVLISSVLSLIVAMPVFAEEIQTVPSVAPIAFTEADVQLVFEQDAQPMQLASLSQTEMKETEGAYLWAARLGSFLNTGYRAVGPITAWARSGNSYSISGGFNTVAIRWGSNSFHANSIGNSALRNANQNLHNWRIPINSWRTNDPGHFHLWRR
jgi:hypothetical protein